jgi:hypothetical protein
MNLPSTPEPKSEIDFMACFHENAQRQYIENCARRADQLYPVGHPFHVPTENLPKEVE